MNEEIVCPVCDWVAGTEDVLARCKAAVDGALECEGCGKTLRVVEERTYRLEVVVE